MEMTHKRQYFFMAGQLELGFEKTVKEIRQTILLYRTPASQWIVRLRFCGLCSRGLESRHEPHAPDHHQGLPRFAGRAKPQHIFLDRQPARQLPNAPSAPTPIHWASGLETNVAGARETVIGVCTFVKTRPFAQTKVSSTEPFHRTNWEKSLHA